MLNKRNALALSHPAGKELIVINNHSHYSLCFHL